MSYVFETSSQLAIPILGLQVVPTSATKLTQDRPLTLDADDFRRVFFQQADLFVGRYDYRMKTKIRKASMIRVVRTASFVMVVDSFA